jgi:hypothetical protein
VEDTGQSAQVEDLGGLLGETEQQDAESRCRRCRRASRRPASRCGRTGRWAKRRSDWRGRIFAPGHRRR